MRVRKMELSQFFVSFHLMSKTVWLEHFCCFSLEANDFLSVV